MPSKEALTRREDGSLHVRLKNLPGFHFILAKDEAVESSLTPALDDFLSMYLPAFAAAAEARGRNAAIEECAAWHDRRYEELRDHGPRDDEGLPTSIIGAHIAAHAESARHFRGLATPSPDPRVFHVTCPSCGAALDVISDTSTDTTSEGEA